MMENHIVLWLRMNTVVVSVQQASSDVKVVSVLKPDSDVMGQHSVPINLMKLIVPIAQGSNVPQVNVSGVILSDVMTMLTVKICPMKNFVLGDQDTADVITACG